MSTRKRRYDSEESEDEVRYRNSERNRRDDDRHRRDDRDRDRKEDRDRDRKEDRDRDRKEDRDRDRKNDRDRDRKDDWDHNDDRRRYDGLRDGDRNRRRQEDDRSRRDDDDKNRQGDRNQRRHLDEDSNDHRRRRRGSEEDENNKDGGPPLKARPRKRSPSPDEIAEVKDNHLKPASTVKMLTINTKSGGTYIPPAKLRMLQDSITDKNSIEYQKLAWEALKKSLMGLTNKINSSNISYVVRELFKENLIRGKGVLARSIMQAQALSQTFSHVYAAFVAIINSKFPTIGELIVKRLVLQFKRGYRRNDKQACVSSTRFLSHLLNQQVAHEVIILQILLLLLERPTDDSVEIAIAMLKECGKKLVELSPRVIIDIFEQLRRILQESQLTDRVQYMIEVIFHTRKDGWKDHESIPEGLDLVEDDDKITHLVSIEEVLDKDAEEKLNVFQFDEEFQKKQEWYKDISRELLGEKESGESGSDSDGSGSDSDEENEETNEESQKIVDMTESNLVSLRRTIYLTIQSSLDYQECAHKLIKLQLNPGQIVEMCYMILDCCAQQRTYEKFFGLLAQCFCMLNKVYVEAFTDIFRNSYETIHRVETNKLRNVSRFFAHLLFTDAIAWTVLAIIKLNEDETTSSSRIFIKILFLELCEYMGLTKLNGRIKDVTLQESFEGLFPRDNPRDTRFAINFFTSIGLGGLTDDLREHLKTVPKVQPTLQSLPADNACSNSSSSSSSSSSSEESSDSSSESSDDSAERRRQRKKQKKKTTTTSKKDKKARQELKEEMLRRKEKAKKKKRESDHEIKEKHSSHKKRRK